MAEELISQYIDQAAIKAQTDFFLKQLEQLDKAYSDLNSKQITVKGANNTKDFVASIKEMEAATKQAAKSQDDFAKSVVIAEKAQQAKIRTDQEALKQIALQEKAEQERLKTAKLAEQQADRNAKAAEREAAARLKAAEAAQASAEVPFTHNLNPDGTVIEPAQGKTSGPVVNDAEKAQIEGILTAKEYAAAQKGVSASFVESQSNAKKYAVTQKEIDIALAQDKLIAQQQTASLKNQAREELAAKGSLEQRRAALIRLNAVYDNQSPQERASAAGQRLQKITAGLTDQIKELEKGTGRTSRNVGNYQEDIEKAAKSTGGFSGAVGKAFSGIRTLANILPGIGLSGIFLLAFEAIQKFAESLDFLKPKFDGLGASQKDYTEVVSKSSEKLSEAKVEVAAITEKVALAKKGFLDKKEVLKDYNDTIGKTIGHAKDLNEADQKLIDLAPKYIQLTFLKAQAQAAADLATAESTKAVQARVKNITDFVDQGDVAVSLVKTFFTQINPFASQADKAAKAAANLGGTAAAEQRKQITEAEFNYNKFIELQKKFLDDAAKYSKTNGIDFYGGKEDPKKHEKQLKTELGIIQELRKELNTLANEEAIGQITPKDADVDRVKAYDKAFKDLFDIGKTANTPIVKQLAVEVSPISQRVIEEKLHDIINKVKKEPIELAPPTVGKVTEIDPRPGHEEEIKLTEEMLQRELTLQQTASLKEQAILQDKYNNGKITKEQFEKDMLEIQSRYSKEAVAAQIKAVSDEIAMMEPGTIERENAEKRLADLQLKYNQIVADDREKKTAAIVKQVQDIQDVFDKLSSLGAGLVAINTTKQKNDLQDLEDARQKSYDQELARINASTLSEADKADKIKVLEAQRQAQKDEFDRKNRAIQQKQAAYDKAVSIANIVFETTKAVIHQLGSGDPYTAFARAIAVGAIGAAQLAIAIAQPLPKFAQGTDNHKGGPFIWGEEGTELAIEPSGKTYLSPDEATLGYAPAGTKIISNKDLVKYTQTFSTKATDKVLSNASYGQSELAGLFKENTRELRNVHKAIKGLPQPKININAKHDPSFQIWVNKNVKGIR